MGRVIGGGASFSLAFFSMRSAVIVFATLVLAVAAAATPNLPPLQFEDVQWPPSESFDCTLSGCMARLEQLIFVTINIPPAIFMDIQSFIDNDQYRGPILYKRLRQEYALVQR